MDFLKIFNTYYGVSSDPSDVRDVKTSWYRECRVDLENDDLVLYEIIEKESNNNKVSKDSRSEEDPEKKIPRFDLIVKNNKSKDYCISLRRFSEADDGKKFFGEVATLIGLLVKGSDSFPSKDLMRSFLGIIKEHPSWTIAHLAVCLNLLDLLKSPCITKYVNDQDKTSGCTPLILSLEMQNLQATQILIEQGAKADLFDSDLNSPFHYIIRNEARSVIEIVAKAPGASASINQRNKDGQTPLQLACLNGFTSCVEQLLRSGADVNSASYNSQASSCSQEYVRVIGDKDIGIFSERLMRTGGTPLHWVKTRASLEMMIEVGCDVNATNRLGDTALHVAASKRRLDSLIWLIIEGAEVNSRGNGGETPLHVAVRSVLFTTRTQEKWMLFKKKVEHKNIRLQRNDGLPCVQILLAFGADFNALNSRGESPRHMAAVMASDNHTTRLDHLIFILHAVGAKRCEKATPECTNACSPGGTFDGVPPTDFCKEKVKIFDGALSEPVVRRTIEKKSGRKSSGKKCRALAIDGGGVKGLVTLRTLKCLEEVINAPLFESFDWVMGTSAGGITTLCLAAGHSVDSVFRSAYRLKEKFIVGPRPYDTEGVEAFFKKEMGENTKMVDIKRPRVAITAVDAEKLPTSLKLFRNYESPRSLLDKLPADPDDEYLWCAARATGAAPTFFKPFKNYLDGAIICNNPTLDLLTEITEYNAAMEGKADHMEVDVVVSVGGGLRPTSPICTIDTLQLDPGIFSAAKVAYSVGHLMKFAVEQLSDPDGRQVDRARAWCHSIGIPFARLQPSLSQYIAVNENDNRVLAKVLWETMAFFKEHTDELQIIAKLLRDD